MEFNQKRKKAYDKTKNINFVATLANRKQHIAFKYQKAVADWLLITLAPLTHASEGCQGKKKRGQVKLSHKLKAQLLATVVSD